MMKLDEGSLRRLMVSRQGEMCGVAIMDGVRGGDPLSIIGSDGNVLTFAEVSEVRRTLTRLGWTTPAGSMPTSQQRQLSANNGSTP